MKKGAIKMTEQNFDKWTDIGQFQGRNYSKIPYDIRLVLHRGMNPEEREAFQAGKAGTEVLAKVQGLYDRHWKESHPSDMELFQQKVARAEQDRVWNLEYQLRLKKARLQVLNDKYDRDLPIPPFERKTLKAEIEQLENQLKVNSKKEEEPTDDSWMDSFLK